MMRRSHLCGIIRFATLNSIILNIVGWHLKTNRGSLGLFSHCITQNRRFSTEKKLRERGRLAMVFSGIVEEIGTVRDLHKHNVGIIGLLNLTHWDHGGHREAYE